MKNNGLTIALIIGAFFFLAAIAIGVAFYKTKKPVKTVSVTGLAEKDFTSDLIVWRVRYDAQDMDMKSAYNTLKNQAADVKAFLKEKGISEDEMDFGNISTEEQTQWRWDESLRKSVQIFSGYQASQVVKIQSKDVEKVEKVIREISELYDKNIKIDSYSPEYYYTKLADLKLEMLAEASKNARDRAMTITENAGGKLGDLKTANTGVFQITAPNSADEDYTWGGAFNTSSKQKRVSINMKLTYYVK
ncbi:MAG: SIMPL domain-containing protein [Bacteroidales bacterium]|nr:SIMPL domain-containing protein [Bacteroidales bacterium]